MSIDERLYLIACSFPALLNLGIDRGCIPGITPTGFYDGKLAEFLYNGPGGTLSSGEFILLEFLLNLCSPNTYNHFNFGRAVNVLGDNHLNILLNTITTYIT